MPDVPQQSFAQGTVKEFGGASLDRWRSCGLPVDGIDSLGFLPNELDDVDLIQSLETSFGIRMTDADARRIELLGDVYDWIARSLNPIPHAQGFDVPAKTFLELRAFLAVRSSGHRIRPSTPLVKLFLERDVDAVLRQVSETFETRTLRLPEHWYTSYPLGISTLGALSTVFVLAIAADRGWHSTVLRSIWLLGIFLALGAASRIIRKLVGPDLSDAKFTVGWCARQIAARNYKKFARTPHNSRDIWSAIALIARELSAMSEPLGANTRIFV